MAEVLQVQLRESQGKRHNRRLRQAGSIPAVLYGHGKAAVSLSLSADEMETVVRHGSRLVALAGGVNEQAFIRELQWNTWGNEILHVDFTRVSAHERVTVKVPVELRGEAPGVKDGGVVQQVLHEIEIECEASSIPEKIEVNVNHLEVDESVTIADLELPDGTEPLLEESQVVVQCNMAIEEEEEAGEAGEEAEPEVIGRPKSDEEEDEEG